MLWLGGPPFQKARGNVAVAHDAADVFLYRDSSVAPLLDMRRRFKAVVDVLGAMIRSGISLSRSVELTAQWDRILPLGPSYPVTLDDLSVDRGIGIGAFYHAASNVHSRLSDFIHSAGMRPFGGGGIGSGRTLWCILISGFGLTWFPLLLFCSVILSALLVVLRFWLILGRIDEEFREAWLPYFLPLWADGYQP